MDTHKPMDPPYPREDNRPYPPPYSEHPTDVNTFSHPLASHENNPPYPTEAIHPVPTSNIPHIYPPYPLPPVTSPPSGVTTIQIIEAVPVNFGSETQYARCTHCGLQGFTVTESKPTSTTHIIALILCCVMLWPFAWIPYVCSSCQKTVHYCSSCNQYLGNSNF